MTSPSDNYQKSEERVHWGDLKLGEIYYKPLGYKPFRIDSITRGGVAEIVYLDQPNRKYPASFCGMSVYKAVPIKTQMENKMNSNTLYQIKGTDTYCTYLATRSDGKFVVEVKGTSEVQTVDKDQLEEVVPFTFGVKFSNGPTYHFLGEAGSVAIGDILLRTDEYIGSIGIVHSVDTKSKAATKRFVGKILKAERDLK